MIAFTQAKTQTQAVVGLHPDLKEWLKAQKDNSMKGPIFPSLTGASSLKSFEITGNQIMETKAHTFTIRADTSPLLEALSTLSDFLHARKVPLQFLDRVLNLLDSPGKLSRITSITTGGTGITIRFEPADVLFALVTTLRTGNLDSFFLEHVNVAFTRF